MTRWTVVTCAAALAACSGGGAVPADAGPSRLLEVTGDELYLRPSLHAEAVAAPSRDPLRSGLYYARHSAEGYGIYTGRDHRATRGISLNWALEISQCVNAEHCAALGLPASSSFSYTLRDPTNPLHLEIDQRSEAIIVHFGLMPGWLSSCAARNASNPASCDDVVWCDHRRFALYPPVDWNAWAYIVAETVDVLLDFTERAGAPRDVYLEVSNEPDAPCYWLDTHEAFLDHYRRTSKAFSQARSVLCESKGFTAERCGRLKFGGPAAAYWDGRIDDGLEPTLVEALVAFALAEARIDPEVRLDFLSFHAFSSSWGGGPRSGIAAARAAYEAAYERDAGASPPFPMPEIILSEWNASDAERAGPRHPALMAETYLALLESDILVATIASLDQQAPSATLGSNDFGLLVTVPLTASRRRPAFFAHDAIVAFADRATSASYSVADRAKAILSSPRTSGGLECRDVVLWDFVPEPYAEAFLFLTDPARAAAAVLESSYAGAQEAGPMPAACEPYLSGATAAQRAFCQDLANGACANIPTPTPSGGHACDATWAGYFASAGELFNLFGHRATTPLTVVVSGLGGAEALALFQGVTIDEDHLSPGPKTIAVRSADEGAVAFELERNAVAVLRDVCVR